VTEFSGVPAYNPQQEAPARSQARRDWDSKDQESLCREETPAERLERIKREMREARERQARERDQNRGYERD
jgi:hypothetical protein